MLYEVILPAMLYATPLAWAVVWVWRQPTLSEWYEKQHLTGE